jgi:hypothetical protein
MEYVVFVVASLIVILAVIELQKRLYRQSGPRRGSREHWVELDTRRTDARDGIPFKKNPQQDEEEDEIEAEQHARARQNGHHAESQ